MQTHMKHSLRSTRQMALAPDFLCPNETPYSSPCHIEGHKKRRFAVTDLNDSPLSISTRTLSSGKLPTPRAFTGSWQCPSCNAASPLMEKSPNRVSLI